MKSSIFKLLGVLLVAAVILAAVSTPSAAPQSVASQGKGFSIVSMQPDLLQQLRAQGKKVSYPFPNTANKGKKFNPVGDTILPLVTARSRM